MSFVPLKFNMYQKERYEELIEEIIAQSDVILIILDARMAELSRNTRIEEILKEKERNFMFVLNKFDIAPRKSVIMSKRILSKIAPVVEVSCKTGFGIDVLRRKIYAAFDRVEKISPLRRKVGLLGYPNMGKSSLINRLSRRGAAKVSREAGFTKTIKWIKAKNMELVDGPGYIESKDKANHLKLALLSAENAENLDDPAMVAYNIVKEMLAKHKEGIEECYNLKITSDDPEEVLDAIGKRLGHLKRGGGVETRRTSTRIIKDWQDGKLKLF